MQNADKFNEKEEDDKVTSVEGVLIVLLNLFEELSLVVLLRENGERRRR
jgi:hypothetical protein